MPFDAVEREISTDRKTESFDGYDFIPLFSPVSNFDQCILHDVFCVARVERYAQRKPIKLVF